MKKAKKEREAGIVPVKPVEEKVEEKKPEEKPELKKEGKPELKVEQKFLEIEAELPKEKSLIASYGSVRIYKVPGEPLLIYAIPVVRPTGPEKVLISTIKEAATRLITVSPEEFRDIERKREFYFKKVKEIIEASPELGVPSTRVDFYALQVMKEMVGYGLIDDLVRDDKLEEIMVIGPQAPVYVFHREFGMLKTNVVFSDDSEIRNIIDRIARDVNRRVDLQSPILDARLPDGSRVNATIPPISLNGSTLTIRKFRSDPYSVVDLIKYGTISSELAAFLWLAVTGLGAHPANILVAGGTGSGKTTTLNVLASFIPPRERVLSIEDTAELNLPLSHWIRFEARPPSIEGLGEITLDTLVKNTLRMRPDRIIVGEIRHAEAFTLFTAMNTGHHGCMGTVHANSAQETLVRLLSPPMNVPLVMLDALDFVLMQQRIVDPRKGTIRRVTELAEIQGIAGNAPQTQLLFEWDPAPDIIKNNNLSSRYENRLMKFTGMSKSDLDYEKEKRKDFLEILVKKNIRKLSDVALEIRKFEESEKHG
ncbi:MAG: CpaF family protein [archaeon]